MFYEIHYSEGKMSC